MSNRKQQKATLLPEVNGQTGLTPIQERAAILLATGKSFTNVADELSLNRGTLYKWQALITFQCFFNQQRADLKANLRNGIMSLADEALQAIRGCLQSDNEATRLKAAMWVTEKITETTIGNTDAKAVLKAQHTKSSLDWDEVKTLDERAYNQDIARLRLVLDDDE